MVLNNKHAVISTDVFFSLGDFKAKYLLFLSCNKCFLKSLLLYGYCLVLQLGQNNQTKQGTVLKMNQPSAFEISCILSKCECTEEGSSLSVSCLSVRIAFLVFLSRLLVYLKDVF